MNKNEIINALDYHFPNPKCELNYNKDYELLLAIMLSAQTTDKRVNIVTQDLFREYDSLEKLNNLTIDEIENKIKSIGLYKTKAKNLKNIVSILYNNNGIVPYKREELEKMPGIGRKTINVYLGEYHNIPNFGVDTHVSRVSKVFEIAEESDDVLKIEEKLKKKFVNEKKSWIRINEQLVLFGRYICTSKKPNCEECKLNMQCKKKL